MLNKLQRLRRLLVWMLPMFFSAALYAQSIVGQEQQVAVPPSVMQVLTQWQVYRIQPGELQQLLMESPEQAFFNLRLGDRYHWSLQLQPSRVLAPGYFLQVATDEGVQVHRRLRNIAFRGYETKGNGRVRLSVDKDFIYGFVEADGERFYIEPLWYHQQDAPRDLFLVYPISAVIKDHDHGHCTLLAAEEHEHYWEKKQPDAPEASGCYEIEIAIASDKSMFNKYGSVGAVEARNIGIINNVQGDYTGVFNHDMEFVIVTQFVVTGTDPWTSSTNAGELLASFRNWGNNNGFGVPFDNGELWTNRNFDGSTIGIAYLNGMCNSNKYHCLQDFSTNSELLRCLTSHEIGHNMSANHDPTNGSCPPNYIMCPFVSTSNTWSNNSVNVISSYITNRINSGCFQPCGANQPLTADFEWSPNPACRLQQVQFTDLSTGNVTSRSWQFPGGSPSASTQQNPVVTWSTAGTYNVVLTVSGPGGTASVTKPVLIKPTPTADFTFTFSGLTYNFTSTSQNGTSFTWDFGDGSTSFEENPTHTYAESGIYSVVLTVENDCGTATKTVFINTIPTAEFTADPTSGCAPLVVQFTNLSSSNTTSFIWQFPGGSPASSNQKNPIVSYQISGTYTVTLTAINSTGTNQTTKTSYITVQNIPSSNFNFTVDTLKVTFTNTSQGANTFLWNFGDGNTSTQQNPVHTYAQSGTYTVTLTASNNCGTTTSTKTVTVVGAPLASFTATPTSGCAPLEVQFTSTSLGNPTSFYWEFPGGTPSTSTAQNPTVTYDTPGNYAVTLVVTNALGSDTLTLNNFISVTPPPEAGFTSTTSGFNATFSNTSTNATEYNWDFGDGNTSTEETPEHTYAEDGTYTVTLIAIGPCGADTLAQTVTIVTPPTAGFTAAPTSGCGPLEVQFTSTSSANAVEFYWEFPGGTPDTSTLQNPVVTYSAPGTYSVTLVVSNAAGSDTLVLNNLITVAPPPAAGFTVSVSGANASFTNTSANATTYSWDFGDGNTSTAQDPQHTYANDGTYTVTLTATGSCGTSTTTQTVTIATPPTAGFTATPTADCGPLTVQFTSTSSSNATSFQWFFPGGTPSSSTAQNPTVTYSSSGTYSVTLIVSNPQGSDTLTQSNYIQVFVDASASFTADVSGATATFENTSTSANTYLWDFGDGNTSTEENPQHTYAEDGTYTVTLIAANSCGADTFTQTITIVTPPTAGFTAGPTSGCAPLTVQFTSTSSANAVEFFWEFPGGTPPSSTEQNPVVTYDTPGTYSVTLTVSNAAGSSTATETNFVVVAGLPTAAFGANVSGATASFTNQSDGATTYAWDFGDGNTSAEPSPEHTYAASGTYTVVLTAINDCGTSTATQTVTVLLPPTAAFSASATEGCAPLTVTFTNQSSPDATEFEWTFEGGTPATSTEANPTVVFETPGVYMVTLVASNPAGSSTSTMTIAVQGPPAASFTAQTAGLSVVLTNTSQNATAFRWDFGDGNTSTEANPTHTYALPGAYVITLRAENDCGTTEVSLQVEILGSAPIAAFKPSATQGCLPLVVQFTDLSAGQPIAWNWSFPGGMPSSSTEQNPTVTYSAPGVYSVTLIVTNAYGTDTLTQTSLIEVLALPVAAFDFTATDLTVAFTNQSQHGTAYTWNFGDGNMSNEANPTHTYASPSTYTVSLTVLNNCGAATLQKTIVLTSNVRDAAWIQALALYPNPSTGRFTLEMRGDPTAELAFALLNPAGRLVYQTKANFAAGALQLPFDLPDLPSGLYSLIIRRPEGTVQVNIAIQR